MTPPTITAAVQELRRRYIHAVNSGCRRTAEARRRDIIHYYTDLGHTQEEAEGKANEILEQGI